MTLSNTTELNEEFILKYLPEWVVEEKGFTFNEDGEDPDLSLGINALLEEISEVKLHSLEIVNGYLEIRWSLKSTETLYLTILEETLVERYL